MNESSDNGNDRHLERIESPADREDAEALREYGRQLAMDSLLFDALAHEDRAELEFVEGSGKVIPLFGATLTRRAATAWVAAAACAMVFAGVTFWKYGGRKEATLDPRWTLVAADDASYRILAPDRVRLDRGELRFASSEPAPLTVETPRASAVAGGTEFLIGHHFGSANHETEPDETMKRRELTRLLVLSGTVTLANSLGAIDTHANEAAIAGPEAAPEKVAVRANSTFAFDLYKRMLTDRPADNLFFSPHSLSNALLMTAEGARGPTADEMGKVLGFPASLRRIGGDTQSIPWEMGRLHVGQAAINRLLNQGNDDFDLRIANALWGEQTFPFLDAYKKTIAGAYDTGAIQLADFIGDPENERLRINAWAEQQTNDRIQDLLPQNTIDEGTRLVLTNAVYFKADWTKAFNPADTKESNFMRADGSTVKVDMMQKQAMEDGRYAAFNEDGTVFDVTDKLPSLGPQPRLADGPKGFSMMEFPYQGDELSMIVIAPNRPGGLPLIEGKLAPETLETWISHLKQRKVAVSLPKFRSETSYEMNDTLKMMGMVSAFINPTLPGGADFSGISRGADPTELLYISLVLHKAFVDVSEEGTEAAAATAVVTRFGARPTNFVPTFRADRPFIYLIRHRESGAILFLGRMLDPTA